MTRGIIRAFSLPNNLFIAALLKTVIAIILILCFGYVIGIHMGLSKEDYKVFFKASIPSAAVLYAVFFISGLIGFIA